MGKGDGKRGWEERKMWENETCLKKERNKTYKTFKNKKSTERNDRCNNFFTLEMAKVIKHKEEKTIKQKIRCNRKHSE
jgi:hypothetical protein